MNEFEIILAILLSYVQGLALGYVLWGPNSHFKRGFMDGLTLKPVRTMLGKLSRKNPKFDK